MKKIFCFFTLALSLCMYPALLYMNREVASIYNNRVELDVFNWYRMLLVGFVGIISFRYVRRINALVIAYISLCILSCLCSEFPQTSIYGTPLHHEGLIALLGYVGIYLLASKYGFFKKMENCLGVVVYVVASVGVLQVIYGNFLSFPLFKLMLPEKMIFQAVSWPIYSTMGGPNNLGLFCALFFPYCLIKKKYFQAFLLISLAISSQTRGALLSIFITTAFISRRNLLYLTLGIILLCIPIHRKVIQRIHTTTNQIHYPLKDSDLSGRVYMWKESVDRLSKTTLIGDGPATFVHYFPQFKKRGNDIGFKNLIIDRPHNLYINIWQGTGLISLLILGCLVLVGLIGGQAAPLKMGVLGFLISGFFTDSMLSVTPYFLIFLGGLQHEYDEARRHDKRKNRTYAGTI